MKTVDDLVADIVNSYDEYGGINLEGTNNFPNRETVVAVLKDIQTIIFPGFHRFQPHSTTVYHAEIAGFECQ